MKKCLSVLLVVLLLACMLPTTVFAVKDQEITIVSVKDILDPLDGQKPDLSGTAAHSTKYTVKKISWSEYDSDWDWSRDLEANDTFKIGNYYVVFVTVEAKTGYYFKNAADITATVNGETANKYPPKDDGKTFQFYYSFPLCKKNIERVDLTIVNPVIGKTPTFARINTEEYESKNTSGVSNQTNGVTWTNQKTNVNITISNPFKADGKYTVKYYLTAKENYWFNGTKYYINGKQVYSMSSNAGMTQVVVGLTDLIPGDGKKEISTLDLSVTAPKEGEKPDFTKIDGTGYYSDNGLNGTSTKIYKNGIAWYKSASSFISPGTTETFVGDSDYTVKISLTPKDGYKFSKSLTAKINGKTATIETFDDGSVNASVKLTALKKEHKHTDSNWKNDTDNHWKVCTDTTCGSITVNKEAHKDANKDNKCDTCGYVIPKEETPVTSTPNTSTPNTSTDISSGDKEPTTNNPTDGTVSEEEHTTPELDETTGAVVGNESDKDVVNNEDTDKGNTEKENDDSFPWLIVLLAAAVVILGGVVVVLIIKKKKQ